MSELPRVLLVGPTPPPEGGMARVVADCRSAVQDSGEFAPVVVEVKQDAVRSPGALNYANLSLNIRLYHRLRSELALPGSRLVHMHASVATRGTVLKHLLLARAVRRSGARLLLQPHSGAIEALLQSSHPAWFAGMRRLLALADSVVVSSPYWRELMQEHWPQSDYTILPNGIDVHTYLPPDLPRQYGAARRVLFIGHLTAYKGLAELRDAWESLTNDAPAGLSLDVVGAPRDQGGQLLAAELAALPNVTLHGTVDSARKLELLLCADIFVLPSHYENLPIALLEAMASGCACVASHCGAIPEVLAGGCGVTVPVRDGAALAAALSELARDGQRRSALGHAARERVVAEYSMERFAAGLIALYKRFSN